MGEFSLLLSLVYIGNHNDTTNIRRYEFVPFLHFVQLPIYYCYQFCCIFAKIHNCSWHVLQKVCIFWEHLPTGQIKCRNCTNVSTCHSCVICVHVGFLYKLYTECSFRFWEEEVINKFLQKKKHIHVYFKSFKNVQLREPEWLFRK